MNKPKDLLKSKAVYCFFHQRFLIYVFCTGEFRMAALFNHHQAQIPSRHLLVQDCHHPHDLRSLSVWRELWWYLIDFFSLIFSAPDLYFDFNNNSSPVLVLLCLKPVAVTQAFQDLNLLRIGYNYDHSSLLLHNFLHPHDLGSISV